VKRSSRSLEIDSEHLSDCLPRGEQNLSLLTWPTSQRNKDTSRNGSSSCWVITFGERVLSASSAHTAGTAKGEMKAR